MKKYLLTVFSLILVVTMLLTSTGSALAAPLNGGPSISAPSGGGTVTLTTIPVAKLPGIEKNASGTIFPQGHASGDRMFAGDGVQVSGLVGYATLSIPLKNYTFGWSGNIYQYLDGAWVVLPTTITKVAESNDGTASATIYSNGIYALLVGYKLSANLHVSNSPKDCSMLDDILFELWGGYDDGIPYVMVESFAFLGSFDETWAPVGTSTSIKVTNVVGATASPTFWRGNTTHFSPGFPIHSFAGVLMYESPFMIYFSDEPESFDLVGTINGCSLTFNWPDDYVPPVY